jgi:hypothetical protein
VEPAVAEVIGGYLARHPSRAALPEESVLLGMHQRLAVFEQEEGPLRPLVADNTICFEEHDRRLRTLEGEAGSDLLADFYTATNDLAFEMLETIRAGRTRELVSLSLMLAVAHRYYGDPPSLGRGFVSFRSHAEAFLHSCTDPARTRADFDRQYQANRGALTALVHGVLDTLEGRSTAVPCARAWAEALRPVSERADALIRAGQLTLMPPPAASADGNPWSMLGDSPLHRTMGDSESFRKQLFEDPAFKRYRLLLNYTYLQMARLGVMAYGRFRLCHLAANAVEEVLGVNAMGVVKNFTASHPD